MREDKHAWVKVLNPAQPARAAATSALPWLCSSFLLPRFCKSLKLLRISELTCILSAYNVNEPF